MTSPITVPLMNDSELLDAYVKANVAIQTTLKRNDEDLIRDHLAYTDALRTLILNRMDRSLLGG